MVRLPIVEPRTDSRDLRLINAAKHGNLKAVGDLIEEAIDLDASDAKGDTALIYAAMAGHDAIVRALLEAGADYRMVTDDGWDAYHAAMFYGDFWGEVMPPHDEIIRALVEFGYDPKARPAHQKHPIDQE